MAIDPVVVPGPVVPVQPSVITDPLSAPIPWHGISVVIGSVLVLAAGLADAWLFHAFGNQTDLQLLYLGLGGLGLTGAYVAGKAT